MTVQFSENQARIYDYWISLLPDRRVMRDGRPVDPASRPVPRWQDFDILDILPQASALIVTDIIGPEKQIRFRLVGTQMVEAWGYDFTGQTIDFVMKGEYRDYIAGLQHECVETRLPVYSHSRFQWDLGRAVDTTRLMVPFINTEVSETEPSMVLVCQDFDHGKTGPEEAISQRIDESEFLEIERALIDQ